MNKRDEVNKILEERGAILARKRKHEVWKFPDGKTFIRASTTSDRNSEENNLSDLRKLLGITAEHKPGTRRAKKNGNGREEVFHYNRSPNTSLADQLRLKGVAESSLREQIEMLERQNTELLAAVESDCWWCRLKEWVNGKGTV